MTARRPLRKLLSVGASLLGAALVGGLGWGLANTSLSVGTIGVREQTPLHWLWTMAGESLSRLSYDLPFLFRDTEIPPEICMVYVSESSAQVLEQTGPVWDRQLYTDLLTRLTRDQPRAVILDVVFRDKWPEPGVDEALAAAIKENGRVFLAAGAEFDNGAPDPSGARLASKKILVPLPILRAAVGEKWGVVYLQPLDGDFGIRRLYAGGRNRASLAWVAAKELGGALDEQARETGSMRWMNYLGPAGTFPGLDFHLALEAPEQTFRDLIVVVGSRSTLSGVAMGKDDFRNPFNLLGGAFSTGAEVHATALLNLLHHDWLNRVDPQVEVWCVAGLGLLLGGALPRFRPHVAALLALLTLAAIVGTVWGLLVLRHQWFAWSVPVLVELPLALVWAIGTRYFFEERRRTVLRNAFSRYLSPRIVDRIADSDFDLTPGGEVVEASVLFTDLEGFTTLAEELRDPELITRILVKYFNQTTAHILENEGTILNFAGDAITAVWGAPLADSRHVHKAALAASRLRECARIEVDGRILRTRVGLHTGRLLAGNVGSKERFDYSVVGDPVNFASRLEGLNKFFGTDVLISEAVRLALNGSYFTRRLGECRVVGKKEACHVHELLGPVSGGPPPEWVAGFEHALDSFCRGDLDGAERGMRATLMARNDDGPARFFLARIDDARCHGTSAKDPCIIDFAEK